jgi:hypothetical protein
MEDRDMPKGKRICSRRSLGEQVWQAHLDNCKTSGMPIREYCRQNKLRQSSYYYWKSRLSVSSLRENSGSRINAQASSKFPFVQVKLEETSGSGSLSKDFSKSNQGTHRSNGLELTTPRGYRFTICPDTNLGLLSVVLSTLEDQRC